MVFEGIHGLKDTLTLSKEGGIIWPMDYSLLH